MSNDSSIDSALSQHCPLCRKPFARESTRKRHYYYCRTKQSETNPSRRRSCAACVRAKTRCIWQADAGNGPCIRCNDRSAKCEFEAAARRHPRLGEYGSDSGSNGGLDGRQDPGVQGSSANLVPTTELQYSESSQGSEPVATCKNETALVTLPYDGSFTPNDRSLAPDMLSKGRLLETPWTHQLSSTSLFTARTFLEPSQAPLVSLATRTLRSYPFMTGRKGTLAPFISPLLYSWAKTGRGPPQKSLHNCADLIQMFTSQAKQEKSSIWRLVKFEQERILAEYLFFDQWELLAALQALLIYCLLRLRDVPVGNDALDISLLTTSNVISSALESLIGDRCDCQLPGDPSVAWRDWIFNESRRRTVLVFQVLNLLAETTTTVSYYSQNWSITGFVLLPLPSEWTLWTAQDVQRWSERFSIWYEEQTVYGLSSSGGLTKLRNTGAGVRFSISEWDIWNAEVNDFGPLVMTAGAIIEMSKRYINVGRNESMQMQMLHS